MAKEKKPSDIIRDVLDAVEEESGRIPWLPGSVLSIKSFTGDSVRHFLSVLCHPADTVFLEIGTWNGGTWAAAAYESLGSFTGIDKFCDFGGSAAETQDKFREIGIVANIIEADCWEISKADLPHEVNVFFYDGPHDQESHRKALPHFVENMAATFICIVDDWESRAVRIATLRGIEDARLKVLTYLWLGLGEHESSTGWWNGLGVFVLTKLGEGALI